MKLAGWWGRSYLRDGLSLNSLYTVKQQLNNSISHLCAIMCMCSWLQIVNTEGDALIILYVFSVPTLWRFVQMGSMSVHNDYKWIVSQAREHRCGSSLQNLNPPYTTLTIHLAAATVEG